MKALLAYQSYMVRESGYSDSAITSKPYLHCSMQRASAKDCMAVFPYWFLKAAVSSVIMAPYSCDVAYTATFVALSVSCTFDGSFLPVFVLAFHPRVAEGSIQTSTEFFSNSACSKGLCSCTTGPEACAVINICTFANCMVGHTYIP